MHLYAIAGQAQMGKDTVGKILLDIYPHLQRRAFGDDVKRVISLTFDVTREFIEEWKPLNANPPGMHLPMRKVLQTVGDGFRAINPNVWVDRAMHHSQHGIFCDVRYDNELEAISKNNGICILVGRTIMLNDDENMSERSMRPVIEWFLANTTAPLVRVRDLVNAPKKAHAFQWFVRNDGSMEQLRHSVAIIAATNNAPCEG